MQLPRIRTINECLKEIKKTDPSSALTYNFIKNLCEQGKVKHLKNGRKLFVNFDDLLSCLLN